MVTLITEKLQNQTLEDVKAEANMPITQVIVRLYFSSSSIILPTSCGSQQKLGRSASPQLELVTRSRHWLNPKCKCIFSKGHSPLATEQVHQFFKYIQKVEGSNFLEMLNLL